jgi:non-specific serine/threonine protein kinase
MDSVFLVPVLTPHGHLCLNQELDQEKDAIALDAEVAHCLQECFARGAGHGLLQLGVGEVGTALPAVFSYWREFAARYVTALCTHASVLADAEVATPVASVAPPVLPPSDAELEWLAMAAPLMTGAEYLTAAVLRGLWQETDKALRLELSESRCGVQEFLKRRNPAWNLVGRVCFNLAENRSDADAPFAFLATYTVRLSAHSKAQHLPLGQALREYEGPANRDRLLSLLLPVQRAAESCSWMKAMVDAGEIFHPLRWTPGEATQFLRDCPQLEQAGIVVRMPATWPSHRPPRPRVTAKVGGSAPSLLGQDALLDFRMDVTLDGESLTDAEIGKLLAETEGLALVRGHWVEVDREQLSRMIDRFSQAERAAARDGLNFGEAMRMLAGANLNTADADAVAETDWAQVTAGPWLAETLKGLRSQEGLEKIDPGKALKATLRPYQQVGMRWLYLLAKLGLGACLADDMGLGKTIQVISLLLVLKKQGGGKPSLLVAPASLLSNWASELERFAPGLKVMIAHTSAIPSEALKKMPSLSGVDVVIASYGTLLRIPWLTETTWRLAVLDEAQAIKNPNAKQTRSAKLLKAGSRFALTGTPVENRLGDLWSIFDFINPGLLGSPKEFTKFTKRLADRPHNPYGPLRELVRPYILRRLKTDKSVIADLPDKTEVKAFCQLSRKQAALYQQAVEELTKQLDKAVGIRRKGLVLSYLMRFKQICNHPSQWLGDGAWSEEDSGKWARLRDIAEVIAARQDKVLVFTQFREVTAPLESFLGSIFGRPGLVLHGETAVKNRKELVRRFQEDESVGFFVLSLKAGGTGLNLTAASHVIHFDRWWNPAVENQATDRAYRIGQKKNVLVHKFVCQGTVEEKIDQMIESKRQIARDMLEDDMLEDGAGLLLTEMKDDELLKLVALDLDSALKET